MLVKQNSIFCTIYFTLVAFVHCANWSVKLTQVAWFGVMELEV